MAISQETITAVQSSIDIVSVVGEYTALSRRGGNDWWGCCPFHNEKTASFHVDGEKKFYYCFGCHAGGDMVKFIMEMEKVSYGQAVALLAARAGIDVHYTSTDGGKKEREAEERGAQYIELYERVSIMFNYLLMQDKCGKMAKEYVKGRGITEDTIASFRLGYAPRDRKWLYGFLKQKNFSDEFLKHSGLFSKKYEGVSFFSDRLMFPIMDRRGRCVAFGGRLLSGEGPKYLNSADMEQYKKGETLFAFHIAKKAMREERRVIFCEGYMDCIAYHQCGISCAVAPLGTALTEEQLKIVRPFVDKVILSFDSDAAGTEATRRALLMCRKMDMTCYVVLLDGGKDPAEIMNKLGSDVLTKYVDNAIVDSDFLLGVLRSEWDWGTADGLAGTEASFYEYVDALSGEVQKERELQKLSLALSSSYDAIRRDYEAHTKGRRRKGQAADDGDGRRADGGVFNGVRSAELCAVLAAFSNVDFAAEMKEVDEGDFADENAKSLFLVLKDYLSRGEGGSVLSFVSEAEAGGHIPKGMSALVCGVLSSGEFACEDGTVVHEGVRRIKHDSLKRRSAELTRSMCGNNGGMVQDFLADKMKIDSSIKALSLGGDYGRR